MTTRLQSAANSQPAVLWVDWLSDSGAGSGPFQVKGRFGGDDPVDVTVTLPSVWSGLETSNQPPTYFLPPEPYSGQGINPPGTNDMIQLASAGKLDIAFGKEVTDPYLAFVSLNGNSYSFDHDFEIISQAAAGKPGFWGIGTAVREEGQVNGKASYRLNGVDGEPQGVIQFFGTFDRLSLDVANSEMWNGFTLGLQAVQSVPKLRLSINEPRILEGDVVDLLITRPFEDRAGPQTVWLQVGDYLPGDFEVNPAAKAANGASVQDLIDLGRRIPLRFAAGETAIHFDALQSLVNDRVESSPRPGKPGSRTLDFDVYSKQAGGNPVLGTAARVQDQTPVISVQKFDGAAGSVIEGDVMRFTIQCTGKITSKTEVFAELSGQARSLYDYLGLPTGSIVFKPAPSNIQTAIVSIPTIDEAVQEGEESIKLTLKSGANYAVDKNLSSATGTIRDGTIITANVPVATEGSPLELQLTRQHAQGLIFDQPLYGVVVASQGQGSNAAAPNGAQPGADFDGSVALPFCFPANEMTTSVLLPTIDDEVAETTEDVIFDIIGPAEAGLSSQRFYGFIKDNDSVTSFAPAKSMINRQANGQPAVNGAIEPDLKPKQVMVGVRAAQRRSGSLIPEGVFIDNQKQTSGGGARTLVLGTSGNSVQGQVPTAGQVPTLIAGGRLVSQGGGTLIANGGGNLVGNDAASFKAVGLVGNDAASLNPVLMAFDGSWSSF